MQTVGVAADETIADLLRYRIVLMSPRLRALSGLVEQPNTERERDRVSAVPRVELPDDDLDP